MKKIKKALVCMSLTCTALASVGAEQLPTCEPLSFDEFSQVINAQNTQSHVIGNPFQPGACVPVYYKTQEFLHADKKFFDNDPQLMSIFQQYAQSTVGPQVQMLKSKGGKIYSFMLLDMNDEATSMFRKHGNKMSVFDTHFDEFIQLHETLHLDPSNTVYGKHETSEKEAISDIGAVLLIGAKHDFTISEMASLMHNVYSARRSHFREFRDKNHYNSDALYRAVTLLKEMEETGQNLTVRSFNEASAIARTVVNYDESKDNKPLSEKVAFTHDMFKQFYKSPDENSNQDMARQTDVDDEFTP